MAPAPKPFAAKAATPEDALKAGRKFEAMFVGEMLKPMFDTLPTDGYFSGGQGEEMFRSLLVDNIGKSIAAHGNGIGLASSVSKALLSAQEVSHERH